MKAFQDSPQFNDDCFSVSTACARIGLTAARHSRTPFTLPGKLIINVPPRIPETARESAAFGVILRLSMRIRSAIPGTFLSITARVASGVTSRGDSPAKAGFYIGSFVGQNLNGSNVKAGYPENPFSLRTREIFPLARRSRIADG
jgi:hypothetical protein